SCRCAGPPAPARPRPRARRGRPPPRRCPRPRTPGAARLGVRRPPRRVWEGERLDPHPVGQPQVELVRVPLGPVDLGHDLQAEGADVEVLRPLVVRAGDGDVVRPQDVQLPPRSFMTPPPPWPNSVPSEAGTPPMLVRPAGTELVTPSTAGPTSAGPPAASP